MPESMPYTYFISHSVRPKKVVTVAFKLDSDSSYEWEAFMVESKFPCSLRIHGPKGWMTNTPIHSFNLGNARRPMQFVMPIPLSPDAELRFLIYNDSEGTRKWNRIQLALFGSKIFNSVAVIR